MRDVYAASFELVTPGAFEAARSRILAWSLTRYPAAPRLDAAGDNALDLNATDRVEWGSLSSPATGDRAWWLVFRHVDSADPTLMWRSEAQVVQQGVTTRFTLRLIQESLQPHVRPAQEIPGRPRIVRELANDLGGRADGRLLGPAASAIRSDGVGLLVDLLVDPDRRLPVVVVSTGIELARPATDPQMLADQLVGIAHVFAITTTAGAFELTGRVGKVRSVFDGAVRLYWPGFSAQADPFAHRLWMSRTVEAIDQAATQNGRPIGFARHVLGLLGDVSALRIQSDPVVRALRRESEALLRTAEREEWARLAALRKEIPDEFAEEFDRQTRRIEELELRIEILDEELEEARRENDALKRNFGLVQEAAVARERANAADAPLAAPTSITEALDLVRAAHPTGLIVLDEAVESAGETKYRQVGRAFDALRAVGEVADGWAAGTLGMSFDDAFAERGFELRKTSAVTQGRFPKEYGCTYDGRRVLLGPHLALGDGGSTDTIFRVYWHLDEANRRFVVGSVGRHLPTIGD